MMTFLSKNGEAFGPFDEKQFQELRMSEEFKSFDWICTDPKKGWKPLHLSAPPAVPVFEILKLQLDKTFLVLCHNHRILVSGVLQDVNSEGATLGKISSHLSQSMPLFRRNSKVVLSILDSEQGQSENIQATVNYAIKSGKAWSYKLLWQEFPLLISSFEAPR